MPSAANCATMPATMAHSEFPKYISEKLSDSSDVSKPRALCSQTSHDSKAEKRSEVAMPPVTLPSISVL